MSKTEDELTRAVGELQDEGCAIRLIERTDRVHYYLSDESVWMLQELGRVLCGDEGAPLSRILANAKAVTTTLDATQARCTELLTENRELRKAELARRGVGAIPSFRIAALDPPHAVATQESLDKMTRQLGLLRESIECLSNESAYTAEKLKEMRTAMKGQG
jgi:hypothetical protein